MTALVTVIIPAYNAALTIDETLYSVRSQTYRNLEILVVDDGSQDETIGRVQMHSSEDARIQLIKTENGGVAKARNLAISRASGKYIAPIDADDLWHPTKIEKQVEAIESAGDRVGLVYTWYRIIDEKSNRTTEYSHPFEEGDVLARMCLGNLVGNGSSPLMRLSVVREAGGYDPGLHAAGAQGCEDLKLYFQIASNHHFRVIKEELTGYRVTATNMSSNSMRMLRSYDAVMSPFRNIYADLHDTQFRLGRILFITFLFLREMKQGRVAIAAILLSKLLVHKPRHAIYLLMRLPVETAKQIFVPKDSLSHFMETQIP